MNETRGPARSGKVIWTKVSKLVGLKFGLPFVRLGDAAREKSEWIDAVVEYRRGLSWMPWREDLKIQIGNCLKEYGDYEGAVRAYRSVVSPTTRMEAQAQLLDVNRRAGNVPYAIDAKPPKADEPLGALPELVSPMSLPGRLRIDRPGDRFWLGTLGRTDNVNLRTRGNGLARIKLDQIGAMSLQRDRVPEPVLAGVIAVRGRIFMFGRITSVSIVQGYGTDEKLISTIPVSLVEPPSGPLNLFVFNGWIDSAVLSLGRSWLSVQAEGKENIVPAGLFVNVVPADNQAPEWLASSSFVPSPEQGVPVDESVIAAPAEIRPAARSIFERPIRSILVIRADQLGDLSATLPAMRRLRELFPNAHITALVQPAVSAIVLASAVVDDVLTIALDYDVSSERRHLSRVEEERLKAVLQPYDLAIDLCPGRETRPLLLLCDATYLVGFEPDRFPYLDFGVTVRSFDKVNRLEKLSHAAHVSSLIEILALAIAQQGALCRELPSVTKRSSRTGSWQDNMECYTQEPGMRLINGHW